MKTQFVALVFGLFLVHSSFASEIIAQVNTDGGFVPSPITGGSTLTIEANGSIYYRKGHSFPLYFGKLSAPSLAAVKGIIENIHPASLERLEYIPDAPLTSYFVYSNGKQIQIGAQMVDRMAYLTNHEGMNLVSILKGLKSASSQIPQM